MLSSEIRNRFLDFFKKRGHVVLPSASLIPENDPSVLFNTAGMQPLVPYLMGQPHPLGKRLASVQKCVRTGDLEDIGDNRHFSFFEMLGNWSLGDYFKQEAITWSYEFLTNKEEGLGLDPKRLAVTIFKGDENAPYDQESKDIWMSLGIPESRIFALSADDNWWSPGDNGPCGPCSEMFYDMNGDFLEQEISHDDFIKFVQEEKFIEIWNDVFMEYEKKDGVVIGKLSQKNVDTGAGLERLTAVMQGKQTAYDTDLFIWEIETPIDHNNKTSWFDYLKDFNGGAYYNERFARIVLDHVRTATFIIADGIIPSNKDRGYVLRRLIRRAINEITHLGFDSSILVTISQHFIIRYSDIYPELSNDNIQIILLEEIEKFQKALGDTRQKIMKTLELRNFNVTQQAQFLFDLFQSFGSPLEFSVSDIFTYHGVIVPEEAKEIFHSLLKEHQEKSRAGSEQKFKGGLGGTSDKIIRSHTAHHLLLAALRQVLGDHVHQRGSNITEERIRIDFSHDVKMTDEQKSAVEQLVNKWIAQDLPMQRVEMPREAAEKIGAEMEFGIKYPDIVSVYYIGNNLDTAISKEFCGGPHIDHTGSIGTFNIQKEEASSAGVRRIKATIK